MTTPKRPAEATPKTPAAAASGKAADPLAGMPPMPKTWPAKSAPAMAKPAHGAAAKAPAASGSDDGLDAVTKKELFTRVKARTGRIKGSDVRGVMDAVLDELGSALVAGEALKLPALGTMKVQRHKQQDGADIVVCKLRRKKPPHKAKDPLAKPAAGS